MRFDNVRSECSGVAELRAVSDRVERCAHPDEPPGLAGLGRDRAGSVGRLVQAQVGEGPGVDGVVPYPRGGDCLARKGAVWVECRPRPAGRLNHSSPERRLRPRIGTDDLHAAGPSGRAAPTAAARAPRSMSPRLERLQRLGPVLNRVPPSHAERSGIGRSAQWPLPS
jgi:hypothetical protein